MTYFWSEWKEIKTSAFSGSMRGRVTFTVVGITLPTLKPTGLRTRAFQCNKQGCVVQSCRLARLAAFWFSRVTLVRNKGIPGAHYQQLGRGGVLKTSSDYNSTLYKTTINKALKNPDPLPMGKEQTLASFIRAPNKDTVWSWLLSLKKEFINASRNPSKESSPEKTFCLQRSGMSLPPQPV